MRVPPFGQYQRFLAGFGLFISGAVIGSAIYMSIHQQQFSVMYVQMHKYQEENAKLKQDVESLNKYRSKQSLISTVHVYLQNQDDTEPFTEDIQQEIEGDVKKELKIVVGQKASYVIDARPLYEKLISQKSYQIHDKHYLVEVKSMVLVQSELSVWITAKVKRT
ncbi:Sporulation membrane protein YtrI [compost metagenome]